MLPNCASAIPAMSEAFFHPARMPVGHEKNAGRWRNILKKPRLTLPHFKEMVK